MNLISRIARRFSRHTPVPETAATKPKPTYPQHGPRLNLGCGNDYREGYVNIDLNSAHRVDLLCDVSHLAPIDDQTCCEVLAQDVLEHLPRAKGSTCLLEWNRVLQMGGLLSLRLPSVVDLARLLEDPRFASVEQQHTLLQCMYGTQGYDGDFHLNGYTRTTLTHALQAAGFQVIEIELFDEWLFDVQAQKVRHTAPNPMLRIEGDEAFLRAAYLELFNREADPGGLDYYLSCLAKGIARESVLESLMASPEYLENRTGLGS